mmetsp:Transcript_4801/g.12876  ORF Transcript_4801/g.12876 Transcript_4801/m.12876 type:complete len:198 (-) Transcript_4801:757-1350(-)
MVRGMAFVAAAGGAARSGAVRRLSGGLRGRARRTVRGRGCAMRPPAAMTSAHAEAAAEAAAMASRGVVSALRLSFDHKASAVEEQARIGAAGGFVAAKRVNGVLSVSRALGDHAMKNVVIPEPYVSEVPLCARCDRFVILACDGLWDVMDDLEAAQFVYDRAAKGVEPHLIARKLVKAALDRGSTDNISVMVVKLAT